MLEQIRGATRSWLSMIVIGLLVVSFALWGVNDIFLADPNPPVVTIGDTEITTDVFARELDIAFRQGRQQYGPEYTMAVALDFGLATQVIEQIVDRVILTQLADEIGVRTSDDELARQIATNPTFQGATGSFDMNTYREFLFQLRLAPSAYEEILRSDIERTQILASLASGANVPRSMAELFYSYAYERRAIEYFVLPPIAVETPSDPGDEVLTAYFANNRQQYHAPEYRTLTILHMSPDEIADDVEVPEEDIVTMFEVRRDSLSVPERRAMRQLTFTSLDEAELALNAINNGVPFNVAGESYIDLGNVTRDEIIDAAIVEAAFGLTEPGYTNVIEGSLAYTIVMVDAITPGTEADFDSARDEIRDELARQIAEEEIYSLSQAAQDLYAGGGTLEAIGTNLRIPVFTVAEVDALGQSSDGARLESVLGIEGLLNTAFQLGEGAQSRLEENIDGSFYIVRVDSVTPDRDKELSEVREEVLSAWRTSEVDNRLSGMAEAAVIRINAGDDFTAVAAELGRQVRAPEGPLRRTETDEVFTRGTLQRLFAVPLNDAVASRMRLGQSWVVARATRVEAAEPVAADVLQIQEQLVQNFQGEVLDTFVAEARRDANVQINQTALDTYINQIPR